MSSPPRLTVSQAAAALGVSEKTIRRRCVAGTLNCEKIATATGPVWMVSLPAHAAATVAVASADTMAHLQTLENDVAQIKGYLAGQLSQQVATRDDVAQIVAEQLSPLVSELTRLTSDNEKLRSQLTAATAAATTAKWWEFWKP
jgi:DNA-binding transcriptional MerR regulator